MKIIAIVIVMAKVASDSFLLCHHHFVIIHYHFVLILKIITIIAIVIAIVIMTAKVTVFAISAGPARLTQDLGKETISTKIRANFDKLASCVGM